MQISPGEEKDQIQTKHSGSVYEYMIEKNHVTSKATSTLQPNMIITQFNKIGGND